MDTLKTTKDLTPTTTEQWNDELQAQTRAFFGHKNESSYDKSAERLGDLLLFEFEQVMARSDARAIDTKHNDTMTREFILRDCGETRADERFHIEYTPEGEIQRAVCQTDFGFKQDPIYQVWVDGAGNFGCDQQEYHYDDGMVSYSWRPLSGESAELVVNWFGEQTSTALEKYYERIDIEQDTVLNADASALEIARQLVATSGTVLYSPTN